MYSCGHWIISRHREKADDVDWSEGSSPDHAMASDKGTTGVLDQVMHSKGYPWNSGEPVVSLYNKVGGSLYK